jgi:mono/diheme cytochrome c family protein
MRRLSVLTLGAVLWVAAAGWSVPQAAGPEQGSGSPAARQAGSDRAVLAKYCAACHNERLKTGGLALDTLDPMAVGDAPQAWEKVVRKLRVGVMPPQGVPQPDEATRSALIGSLESRLDRAAASRPDPGHPSVHRLNRAEYANAIRDLLALDVDAASLLPADDPLY